MSKKNKLIIGLCIFMLAIAGYFIISKIEQNQDNQKAEILDTQQEEPTSRPVTAEELKELQADPSAPEWLKNAQSCVWVGEKVFCKLKGE